ncbi:MAG TPA: DUF4126 domain-containing protein [Methylomirabilota bacterium]|nr:DUF4126 domain-containing protein [Methylomirabilota bacterium]
MELVLGISAGLALSTAAGLRVFVPLLITSAAARLGFLTLTPGMSWLGSDAALVALATAAAVEIAAYYVPWLDHLVDMVAGPAAVTAGIIEMAAVTPELPPLVRWTIAVLAGGGVAGLAQLGTTLLRLKSSALTAGLGNPVVATTELIGAVVLAVLAFLAPILGAVVVVALLVWITRRALRRRARPRPDLARR